MKKFTFSVFLISIFLGFMVILQVRAQRDYGATSSSSQGQDLTSRIVVLTDEISQNKTKALDLQKKHEDYQKALTSGTESNALVDTDLDHYQKLLGQKETRGQGVEITINNDLTSEEMTDFINNLKNINVEAISVNDQRLVLNSAFSKDDDVLLINNKKINAPIIIKAIGNPDVLKEALERNGGILDQLKTTSGVRAEVVENSNLDLRAYQ